MKIRFLPLLLLLAACRREQSIFAPEGPAASRLAELGGTVIGTFGVISLVMFALIFWVALRRKGTLAEHAPADEGGGIRWILIGGFALPALVFAVFFVWALGSMAAFPLRNGNHEHGEAGYGFDHPADIIVTAQQWWWSAEYVSEALCRPAGSKDPSLPYRMKTANEIHIPVGFPVEIALVSRDVIHSFWVPQLHGKVDVVPGIENRIRLVAGRPGRFRGQCSEFCGAQHAHMALWIVAEPPEEFNRWMLAQRAPAHEALTEQQRRGRELFETRACVLCHTIRGTRAKATIGPDLTHIASRRTIASGVFPNNKAYLTAWVTHAQSLKPGVVMPDVTDFTGEELQALVAYLQHLQ